MAALKTFMGGNLATWVGGEKGERGCQNLSLENNSKDIKTPRNLEGTEAYPEIPRKGRLNEKGKKLTETPSTQLIMARKKKYKKQGEKNNREPGPVQKGRKALEVYTLS